MRTEIILMCYTHAYGSWPAIDATFELCLDGTMVFRFILKFFGVHE